jgi:hypothetical protein
VATASPAVCALCTDVDDVQILESPKLSHGVVRAVIVHDDPDIGHILAAEKTRHDEQRGEERRSHWSQQLFPTKANWELSFSLSHNAADEHAKDTGRRRVTEANTMCV